MHGSDSQNFSRDINGREDQKSQAFLYGYHLPFDLRSGSAGEGMPRCSTSVCSSAWIFATNLS
jgi:hypothetical protein